MMNRCLSIIATLGIFCTSITNGEVGAMCKSEYDCLTEDNCSDGYCNCKELLYTSDSVPYCENWYTKKLCHRDKECMENSKCISIRCKCDEGYQRIGGSCRQVTVKGLLETCGNIVGEKAEICDISKKSLCQSKKCVCSTGFVPSPSGECETQASYISRNNLTVYRMKPGLYCRNSEECLEGLVCKDFKCSCPSECRYDDKREVCDCGEVEKGVGHIIVGVILGLLIIIFWYCTIKQTIKRHTKIRRSRESSVDMSEPPSYSLSPVGPEATETVTTSPVGWHADGSPINQENVPTAPEFNDSLTPKAPLPYPVNPAVASPPTTTELGPPPPYSSLFPTATASPPISPATVHVSYPYDTQPAYNPYYQGASNAGSAESESKLNKQQ